MGFGFPLTSNILMEGAEDFLSLVFPHSYILLTLCSRDVVSTCLLAQFVFLYPSLVI